MAEGGKGSEGDAEADGGRVHKAATQVNHGAGRAERLAREGRTRPRRHHSALGPPPRGEPHHARESSWVKVPPGMGKRWEKEGEKEKGEKGGVQAGAKEGNWPERGGAGSPGGDEERPAGGGAWGSKASRRGDDGGARRAGAHSAGVHPSQDQAGTEPDGGGSAPPEPRRRGGESGITGTRGREDRLGGGGGVTEESRRAEGAGNQCDTPHTTGTEGATPQGQEGWEGTWPEGSPRRGGDGGERGGDAHARLPITGGATPGGQTGGTVGWGGAWSERRRGRKRTNARTRRRMLLLLTVLCVYGAAVGEAWGQRAGAMQGVEDLITNHQKPTTSASVYRHCVAREAETENPVSINVYSEGVSHPGARGAPETEVGKRVDAGGGEAHGKGSLGRPVLHAFAHPVCPARTRPTREARWAGEPGRRGWIGGGLRTASGVVGPPGEGADDHELLDFEVENAVMHRYGLGMEAAEVRYATATVGNERRATARLNMGRVDRDRRLMVVCDGVHFRVIFAIGSRAYIFDPLGPVSASAIWDTVWPDVLREGGVTEFETLQVRYQSDSVNCGVWGIWAVGALVAYRTAEAPPFPAFFVEWAEDQGVRHLGGTGAEPSVDEAKLENERFVRRLKAALREGPIPVLADYSERRAAAVRSSRTHGRQKGHMGARPNRPVKGVSDETGAGREETGTGERATADPRGVLTEGTAPTEGVTASLPRSRKRKRTGAGQKRKAKASKPTDETGRITAFFKPAEPAGMKNAVIRPTRPHGAHDASGGPPCTARPLVPQGDEIQGDGQSGTEGDVEQAHSVGGPTRWATDPATVGKGGERRA